MLSIKSIPVYFILIFAPVLWHLDHSLPGITAGFVGVLLLVICWVLFFERRGSRFNPVDLFFVFFVIWYVGRTVGTESSVYTWKLLLGGAAIILYAYVRNIELKASYFDVLFIAGIFQAIWYFVQLLGRLPSYNYLYPGTGGFINPAILAVFLAIACLAGVIGFYYKERVYARVLRGAGVILLLVALGWLGSRAAWVGFMLGVSWIVLTGKRWRFTRFLENAVKQHRFGKFILSLLVIAISASVIYILYRLHPASMQGRFLIWQVAGSMFLEAPWFGGGSFAASCMPAQGAWFEAHPGSPFVMVAGNNEYVFNEFLRVACETGIVGLFFFVGLVVTCFYFAVKGNRVSRFAGGVLVVILVFGLFSYPLSVEVIGAIAIISLAIVSRDARHARGWVVRLDNSFTFILRIAVVLFVFVLSVEYYHEKKADVLLTKTRGTEPVNWSELKTCYERLKGNPDFVLCYGRTLFTRGEFSNALPVLERGFLLRPTSELVCDLGRCYMYRGQWKEAERKYRLAANMVPAYITPRHLLFKLYDIQGMSREARQEAEYMLRMPVKIVNSSVIRARGQARAFLKNNE